MKFLAILLSCVFPFISFSQDELSGYWKGKITQEDGGYIPEYSFEIQMLQLEDSITGRSYVFVDSIYAEMNLSGNIHSEIFIELKDEKIIDHEELQGMEWCIKKYQLFLKRNEDTLYLEGHWQGETSFSTCVPGKIFLEKKIPRA